MPSLTRRDLLAGAAVSVSARAYSQISGANERIRIGVIGCGGMAGSHMQNLMRKSTMISEVSEKERSRFFNITREKINSRKNALLH